MNKLRYLVADADLEITHDSGSRISVRLAAGEGVVELHDNRLLRIAIKNFRRERQQWHALSVYLPLIQQLKGRIDLSVSGRPVARLDSSKKADFFCRRLGLPNCSIRPFALLISLLRPQAHTN